MIGIVILAVLIYVYKDYFANVTRLGNFDMVANTFSAITDFFKDIYSHFTNVNYSDFDNILLFCIFLVILSLMLNTGLILNKFAFKKKLGFFNKFNKTLTIGINVTIIAIVWIVFSVAFIFRQPKIESNYPEYDAAMINYDRPVEVEFNIPVLKSSLKPSITPELKGKWVWESYWGFDSITRKGKFILDETVYPGERFVPYIAGIQKPGDSAKHEFGFVFWSVEAPQIKATTPTTTDAMVSRDSKINIEFNELDTKVADVNFKIIPEIEFDTVTEDNKVSLVPKQFLTQGQEYIVEAELKPKKVNLKTNEVVEVKESQKILDLKFNTAKEPLVTAFIPIGNQARVEERVKIIFAEDMNKESVESRFSITPDLEGEIAWEDNKTLVYNNKDPLPKDTAYSVKVAGGSMSANGGILEKDLSFDFKTIGKVKVAGFAPNTDSSYNSEYTLIGVYFDQPVDKESAQTNLRVSPGVAGTFEWQDDKNLMIYRPSTALAYSTTYTVEVLPGVKTIYGLDSDESFRSAFVVRPNVVVLDLPIYYQPSGFACNIFTAKIVLGWKGYYPSHVSLISEVGYDDSRSGDNWTGNPYYEYVGNSDGSWGYGAYWPVVQRILSNRGIASQGMEGWNIAGIANEVQQGHPVIIWRYNGVGGGGNISWTSSDGSYVYAFNGQHGSVVTGFTGPADNPYSFRINDPWLGILWLDASTLDAYWSYSGRMALIVY
jgi:uncharacterized protein YvpB